MSVWDYLTKPSKQVKDTAPPNNHDARIKQAQQSADRLEHTLKELEILLAKSKRVNKDD